MIDDLFFDTDCLSSFLWIDDTNIITKLYGGKIILPDPVYQELSNPSIPHIKNKVDALLNNQDVKIKNIEAGTKEYRLYKSLVNGRNGQKIIGHGEAGGIALAKAYNGILASNNYKDIASYINKYNLRHIDTATILVEALKQKIITETQGNSIWQAMLSKRRKLPAKTFSDYLQSFM